MNRSGGEAFARLAQQLNRARMQATKGGGGFGGGGGGGGGGNGFRGFMAGGGLLATVAVGGILINYSIFNGEFVDRYCAQEHHHVQMSAAREWRSEVGSRTLGDSAIIGSADRE